MSLEEIRKVRSALRGKNTEISKKEVDKWLEDNAESINNQLREGAELSEGATSFYFNIDITPTHTDYFRSTLQRKFESLGYKFLFTLETMSFTLKG